jgi:glycosyltransferase involved in cell wall biosynthesis
MKVMHVHHHYYPVIGGVERAIQRISEELFKLNHEVHVITSKFGAEGRPKDEVVNGVHVHRMRALRLHFSDLTIPLEAPEILKEADAVVCWSQNSYFTYKVCRDAKRLGKPSVVYFIGVDYLEHHYNPFVRVFGHPYQKWITRKMANLADVALVTNDYERELLGRGYSIDAIVLPHGIDEEYLKLPNVAEVFRRKYNIDERIVAYIGRIHPTKGLDMLVKAFIRVAKEEPNTVLVIAGKGDGEYLKNCLKIARRAGIEDRIKVLGYVSEEDKIALIDASDVVVLPTRHTGESYPLLINEVLARGKRLVMTRGSIASNWVEESGVGIVAGADPRSLAQAIVNELERGGAVTKNVKIPTWKDVASELLELIQRLELHHWHTNRSSFPSCALTWR